MTETINGEEYLLLEEEMYYMVPAMIELNELFLTKVTEYLDIVVVYKLVYFCLFHITLFVVFFRVWMPFL